jgi:hypothetical protein
MKRLIVLSGEAGAGKDSLAKLLVEEFGWTLYSLAGPLKRFAADMFGFTEQQLYGPSSFRNAPDPRWARPCPKCNGTGSDATRFPISGCTTCEGCGELNDNSPRRVLQLLGEEYLRQLIHPDALTMRARSDIEMLLDAGESVVINDARNPNDRDNLHKWLGAVRIDVRSERTKEAKPNSEWRQHSSEQRQPTAADVEHVMQNDEEWPFPSMKAKAVHMLQQFYVRAYDL